MADGCRQENHANAGFELGAFIGAAHARRPRQADGRAAASRCRRSGCGSSSWSPRAPASRARGRCRSWTNRSAARASTVRIAPSSRSRPIATRPTRICWPRCDAAGHPVLHLTTRLDGLGAEFFRWEFATAVAGAALRINPFDEPNVSEAKEKTKELLEAICRDTGDCRRRRRSPGTSRSPCTPGHSPGLSPSGVVRAALASVQPGDYVAFLLVPAAECGHRSGGGWDSPRDQARKRAPRPRSGSARAICTRPASTTRAGPTPRWSFLITADDRTQTEIPEAGYSFSVLKRAQALGDYETLEAHGRRMVRLHLTGGDPGRCRRSCSTARSRDDRSDGSRLKTTGRPGDQGIPLKSMTPDSWPSC